MDMCPFCQAENETIEHALLFCDWTRMVWLGLQVQCIPRREDVSSIYHWMGARLEDFKGMGDFKVFNEISISCGLWSIWKERNKAIHEGKNPNPWAAINLASIISNDYYDHWRKISQPVCSGRQNICVTKVWRPPLQGFSKLIPMLVSPGKKYCSCWYNY